MGLVLMLTVATPATGMFSPAVADDVSIEYRVKAAFLLNFARFVSWPASKFDSAASPISICVLGNDPFDGVLDETVKDKTIGARRIAVRRSARAEDLRNCHIAYVGEADVGRRAADLADLSDHGVLTVHEATDTQPAGAVRFLIEQQRVRFEINTAAATRENVTLSAKLLGVARVILK